VCPAWHPSAGADGRQMMDESVRLLTLQQQLEQDAPGVAFAGLSVDETVRACVMHGLGKKADKIKSDFKVSDKRSASHACVCSSAH
jgi:hypothetical protein